MPVNLGSEPLADFDQPIDLLMDCHRRIEHFLGVLVRLAREHGRDPLNDECRAALETVLAYFKQAAPKHTSDEEESLFPRLREVARPDVEEAFTRLDALEEDHKHAEVIHERIDCLGRQWLQAGALGPKELSELQMLLDHLTILYAEHIRIEDEEIFPLARSAMGEDALKAVGGEMAQRRAFNPGREDSRCGQRRRRQLAEKTDSSDDGL